MTTQGVVLEMTEQTRLRRSRPIAAMTMAAVPVSESSRLASLYRAIWEPLGGGGRQSWTADDWARELNQPGHAGWVAHDGAEDVGMAQVAWSGEGDVGIVVLGIVPARQGTGMGGDLLSRLTDLMWQTPAPNGQPARRVWLWTVPDEHPHAITNYTARGFTISLDLRSPGAAETY